MSSIEFVFTKEIEVYFFFSYKFLDERGNLIPLSELKKFRDEIPKTRPKLLEDIEFDNKKAYYSFFDSFCTDENMPLVVSISPNKVNIGKDGEILNGEITKDDVMPMLIQIRLSQYGIATIRVFFKLTPDKTKIFDNNFLALLLKDLKHQGEEYANAAWRIFCGIWHKISQYQISEPELEHMDIYMVLFSRGIEVRYDDKKIMLADLKRGNKNIPQSIIEDIKKMLVGLAISSYLWPRYSKDFVKKFIMSDISTTENEFQFIAWRNALIYFEGETTELPATYRDYLYDILLGLELLFLIRSSLQLLNVTVDREIGQRLIRSRISLLRLVKFKSYHHALEYLDRWLLAITGWRLINRYAVISHFHDFLKIALQAMRIDIWLNTVGDKINLLRDIVKVQSDKIATMNLVLLTLMLVGLTVLLIFK